MLCVTVNLNSSTEYNGRETNVLSLNQQLPPSSWTIARSIMQLYYLRSSLYCDILFVKCIYVYVKCTFPFIVIV